MSSIYVSPYQYRVYKKFHLEEPESLDNIPCGLNGKRVDFLKIVEAYSRLKIREAIEVSDSRVFMVEKCDAESAQRVIRGRNVGGNYGQAADSYM